MNIRLNQYIVQRESASRSDYNQMVGQNCLTIHPYRRFEKMAKEDQKEERYA